MTIFCKFVALCRDENLDCAAVVRKLYNHDPRLVAALRPPVSHSPRNLHVFAGLRARAYGLQECDPAEMCCAVGVVCVAGVWSVAVHMPGFGWWAKGRRGAVPIKPGRIARAWRVKPWHQ